MAVRPPLWLEAAPLRRARSRLLALLDFFPWTPLGLGLAALAYAALRSFAYAQLDLVWLVTGYATLGLCALSPLFVLPAALWLRWRLRRQLREASNDTLQLETGQRAHTGFSVPALSFLPLVQVRWQWLSPAAAVVTADRQRGRLHESVLLAERGEHAQILRRVRVEDPFGLARVAFRVQQPRRVRVQPHVGGLRYLPSLASLAAGSDLPHPLGLPDGDRLELQRYTPGDPARFIHWRVFARTRRLMVRKPERALAVAKRCAAFFVAGTDDDASAAVVRLALERELLGDDWVFGTDLVPGGLSQSADALQALITSVQARALAGRALPAFVAQVDKQGPASLIVFAPPQPGAWVDAVARLARSRQLRVVIGVDGMQRASAEPLWLRLLTSRAAPRGSSAAALEAATHALGRAGVAVSVLDRGTGRPLSPTAQRALEPAAALSGAGVARAGGMQ